jgi:Tfp pilus assembly protein PilO
VRPLTNLEKFGLAAALIAASTFFYVKYIYDPQVRQLEKTLERRNRIVRDLNQVSDVPALFQLEKTIEQDKKTLAALREKSGDLSVKTGNPDEITRLLTRITQVIEDNHLSVLSITPNPPFQGPLLLWTPFEMDLRGYFHHWMAFLEEIRGMEDAVEVLDLALERSSDHPGMLRIRFLLKI